MADESHAPPYAHPPIVEAILEIRLATEVSEAKQKKANDWIAGRYAHSVGELQVEAKLDFSTRSATFVDKAPIYRLSSADHTDLCSIGVQAIAWVRRAPYEGWSAFSDRIRAELPAVFKALGNPAVSRVGLRYVNRIDVELVDNLAHFERYLNFRIAHCDLLEPTNGFQWQLVKVFPDLGLKAIVQSAVLEPEIPRSGAFSFDIDVYRDVTAPQKPEEIIDNLEAMRQLKNAIFEAGITDEAREKYN